MDTTHDHDNDENDPGAESVRRPPGRPARVPPPWRAALAVATAAALVGGGALVAGQSGGGRRPAAATPCPSSGRAAGADADALLRCLRPSLAFVETPLATGSGVLVDGRYVVTNAHVVEPFRSTAVLFAGGERHDDVPVVGVDFHADVALLGPLDTERRALTVVRSIPAPKSRLFLAGYPGDVDDDLAPAISGGTLSRTRRLPDHALTYLQTDAVIADAGTGGALVDGEGRVVGIAALPADDRTSTLALAGTDTLRAMARIRDRDAPAYRPLPEDPGTTSANLEFTTADTAWVLTMRTGKRARTVRLTVPAETRPGVVVTDLHGDELFFLNQDAVDAIEHLTGEPLGVEPDAAVAPGIFEFELPARAYARIELYTRLREGTTMPVESTVPFNLVPDLDNERPLRVGDRVEGVLDPLELSDTYLVELQAGETVEVFAGSVSGDMAFAVVAPGQGVSDAFEVDDSGIGLSGVDARDRFEATTTGAHRIVVFSADWAPTGYVLRVTAVGGRKG